MRVWIVLYLGWGVLVLAGTLGMLRAQGTRDELWGQRVEHIGLFQLQGLQLDLNLFKGDAVETVVLMTDGDEGLPELSVKDQTDAEILSQVSTAHAPTTQKQN